MKKEDYKKEILKKEKKQFQSVKRKKTLHTEKGK